MNGNENFSVAAKGECEIEIVRTFPAPRSEVFECMTNPLWLARWLNGPPGWSTTEVTNDLQVGGTFTHAWAGPDGETMAMRGTNLRVEPPEQLVRTETFEFGCEPQAGEQQSTLVLREIEGGTSMSLVVRYPSQEARDAALACGMEEGLSASYRECEAVLPEVASS